MELSDLRVHDLLRLASPEAVLVVDPPLWLAEALETAPWVVVRRTSARAGLVAVGIRGTSRDQRCAAYLDPASVCERIAPEDLVANVAWQRAPRRDLPVLDELVRHADALSATGLTWGIAGGAGFELATGAPVLTGASDLDLILRCTAPVPEAALAAFAGLTQTMGCRIDVLVETPHGGFSLAEFVANAPRVLLRQTDGARLVARADIITGVAFEVT